MEMKSFKNVLDSLDYTIVDNNNPFFGIENLEIIREYLLEKRDGEYKHIEMHILPYILWQINYKMENNFKFNDDDFKAEYIKLRKQLINWFIQCNTRDENGNDDVDFFE